MTPYPGIKAALGHYARIHRVPNVRASRLEERVDGVTPSKRDLTLATARCRAMLEIDDADFDSMLSWATTADAKGEGLGERKGGLLRRLSDALKECGAIKIPPPMKVVNTCFQTFVAYDAITGENLGHMKTKGVG